MNIGLSVVIKWASGFLAGADSGPCRPCSYCPVPKAAGDSNNEKLSAAEMRLVGQTRRTGSRGLRAIHRNFPTSSLEKISTPAKRVTKLNHTQ